MVEMFYGPWQLTFRKSDPECRNRLVVLGSDTMDGAYERRFGGDDIVLEVTGSVWSVDIESSPHEEEAWLSCLRDRRTVYDPQAGLVVTLHGYAGDIDLSRVGNVVRCVYRDAELNPPPVADEFDFSYGGG